MRKHAAHVLGLAAVAALAGLSAEAGAQTTVGSFAGPEDLDLSGNFLYAVDVGGNDGNVTVNGLTFVDDTGAPGVTVFSEHDALEYQPATDYGATTDDNNLEVIANSIRWTQAGENAATGNGPRSDVTLDLAGLSVNTAYKLQLLFQDDPNLARGFDVNVEGATIADNFGSSTGNLTSGRLVTHQFTATDDTLNIQLINAGGSFGDPNPILSAATLEVVPEPASLGLIGLGAVGLLARRRRRAI